MSTLALREQDTYERMWSMSLYAEDSPGERFAPMFVEMAKPHHRATILDAGCGGGKGALALQALGFRDVTLCDITPDGLLPDAQALPFFQAVLWNDLRLRTHRQASIHRLFDYAYCCDVLEHIPPTFAMLVVSRLLEVSRKGVFMTISLREDDFGNFIGTPLHQTIQPFPVWKEQLAALGTIVECRDLLNLGVFFMEPLR